VLFTQCYLCHGETATFWIPGNGSNTLEGAPGRDVFVTGDGPDRIYMGAGDDLAEAGHGSDVICGYLGRNGIFGGSGFDWIAAGPGLYFVAGDGFRPLKNPSYLQWRNYKKNYTSGSDFSGNQIINGSAFRDRGVPLAKRWNCGPRK